MNTRRQFLKMTAGAATLGALGPQPAHASPVSATRRVWVLSDLHVGYQEDGKDGAEWFEDACRDLKGAGITADYALTLGDLTHHGTEEQMQRYLKVRDQSGITRWHELAGNHEYQKNKDAGAYIRLVRDTKPYSLIDGNIAWFFLSDEKGGVEGNLSEESCQWLEQQLAANADKTLIVCSHQLVKGTVLASTQNARHIHPADRIAGIIAKAKIDLWLCGHEHHSPYSKQHIARVGDTTYINVASMSHAYKTRSSQSCVLELTPGANEITARRREHDGKRFLPEFEVNIPLRHQLQPGKI